MCISGQLDIHLIGLCRDYHNSMRETQSGQYGAEPDERGEYRTGIYGAPGERRSFRPQQLKFFDDPLEVSLQNEEIDPQTDARRRIALESQPEGDYRELVEEAANSRMKAGPVLLDGDVRRQVANASAMNHTPYFMILVIVAQTAVFAYSYYLNNAITGSFTVSGLPMLEQNKWVLVTMGARYYPCMRPGRKPLPLDTPMLRCAKSFHPDTPNVLCTIRETCGMDVSHVPNQFYRLFTAMFLHSGIIHFLFNVVLFQFFAGISIERDIGSVRMAFIYIVSGIGGFLFTPIRTAPEIDAVTVGASGAIYGLISCILIDLIFSWKLLKSPKWELTKLIIKIILSLAIGFIIPQVDNFSHLGGLISGILASATALPSVHFGNWDRIGKMLVRFISLPLLIFYLSFTIYAFVTETYFCPNCSFLAPSLY